MLQILNKKFIPVFWSLTLILYIFRSIFEPVKYLAFIFYGFLIIISFIYFIKHWEEVRLKDFLKITKEFIIIALFIGLGIVFTNGLPIYPFKELLNFSIILFFAFIYFHFKKDISRDKILKLWLLFSTIIGIIAIIIWANYFFSINAEVFTYFNAEKKALSSTSLTSDYNFYSLFFIFSIIVEFFAIYRNILKQKIIVSQLILWVFIFNIVFSSSRRAIVVLVLLFLISLLIFLLKSRKNKQNKLFIKNIFIAQITITIFIVILLSLIPFRNNIITDNKTREKLTLPVYRYTTIFNSEIPYSVIKEKLWPQYLRYKNDTVNWAYYYDTVKKQKKVFYDEDIEQYWFHYQDKVIPENLFYNGDFSSGLKFWDKIIPKTDSVSHQLINTKYGKAIRVHRINGTGWWPLAYKGRDIIYYKDVTYTFRFKFRIVKGQNAPFNIGWWIKENGGHVHVLKKNITKIDKEWNKCTCTYCFKENHKGSIATFMNSQKANTIIDFADIQLFSNDTLIRPKYIDQVLEYPNTVNLFYNSNFQSGFRFWGYNTIDTIAQELIETPFGTGIRVERKEGRGYWPLIYKGRDIFYQKGQTYTFRFLYHVVKGNGKPFLVGWWIKENNHYLINIPNYSFPIGNDWYACYASYEFEENHYQSAVTFMNSQSSNTIVEFANIELLCADSLINTTYLDQNIELLKKERKHKIQKLMNNDTVNHLSDPRTERWRYGIELFKTYPLYKKIIGDGFEYMYLFNKKFINPDLSLEEIKEKQYGDYPHNPIISSFLYSGIIGGLFYIYFLVLSLWYYWKYRKHHMIFFLMYLISFFFVFFSGNSHFSVPVFTILSIIPFFTKYLQNQKTTI